MTKRHRARFDLWTSEQLHAVAGRLGRLFQEGTTTDRQDWLWAVVIDELEWRADRDRILGTRPCPCQFCRPPFPRLFVERPMLDASWQPTSTMWLEVREELGVDDDV
jgi:hypothetical protein